jgi:hypothetical protein
MPQKALPWHRSPVQGAAEIAARRLIAILIVLMLFSTIAAALVEVEDDEPADEPPPRVERPVQPPGDSLRERVGAGAERPHRIEATVGDRLELLVDSERGLQIAIPAFGLIEFAAPNQPARFELLLRTEGEIQVEAFEDSERREVATIVVAPRSERDRSDDQPATASSAAGRAASPAPRSSSPMPDAHASIASQSR